MKREFHIFLTALMFYTRIPCPKWVNHSEDSINQSIRYFPLIGWVIGGISALVYLGASEVFPSSISLVISMIVGILITGAFHEDGLADVCDGFGGGWTKEKILSIMKDSRLGTYGAVALFFVLISKFLTLQHTLHLPHWTDIPYELFVVTVFISAHSLSRFIAATAIITHCYVRDDESSKAKPVAKNNQSWFSGNTLVGLIFGFTPLTTLAIYISPWLLTLILLMYLSKVWLTRFFTKWIGGYTGDCLGAIQQVSEIIFYLGLIAIWKFI